MICSDFALLRFLLLLLLLFLSLFLGFLLIMLLRRHALSNCFGLLLLFLGLLATLLSILVS